MRNKFGEWITEAATNESRILLLSGDIGFGIFDEFREQHPKRFINCGIAEQNMIGLAAGLAAEGFKPFVYTIIPFLIYRPFEFIRNLIAYQNLGVVLVGVGGGYSYDKLGFTHFGIEDLGLISMLPNFSVYTPFDPYTSGLCFSSALASNSPSYVRLMKGGEDSLDIHRYGRGYCILAEYGSTFNIIVHGSIAVEAIEACRILQKEYGVAGRVTAVYDIDSLPIAVSENPSDFLIAIEEHVFPGIFAKFISELKGIDKNKVQSFYLDKRIEFVVGSRNDLLRANKLDSVAISRRILEII